MKKKLLLLALVMAPSLATGQQVIDLYNAAPDSGFWFLESVASSDTSGVVLTYTDEQVAEGANSMRIDYTVQATEAWGGFTNIMRIAPGSEVFDFSLATHLSLKYYVGSPSSLPGTVEFRILLKDASETGVDVLPEDIGNTEFWYSHNQILEAEPGWNELLLPLEDVQGITDGGGMWLPGWAGAPGNGMLDLDKIKAVKFEFSINGSPHNVDDPSMSGISVGTIYLDDFRAVGHRNPVIDIFDDASTRDAQYFGTGSGSIGVTDITEGAFEDISAQMDWTVDADQPWGGFTSVLYGGDDFLADASTFSHYSLRYNNLASSDMPGNVVFRIQLHEFSEGDDMEEVWIYENAGLLDEAPSDWQQLLVPLTDRGFGPPPNSEGFSNPGWSGVPGNSKLDFDKVKSYEIVFSGINQGTVSTGSIAFDNLELYGFRETDFTAPNAPEGVTGVPDPDNNFNLVIWQDVPGETGETYNVYASLDPISDVNDPGVESVALGIARGAQTAVHSLTYPLADTEVSYFYAVTATDPAGNTSAVGASAGSTTNTARGVSTISLNPPGDFAADGDLGEWETSGIQPFVLTPSGSKIAIGSFNDDNDLTATIYMAVDNEYLYIAADVIDDVFSYDPEGNWWEDDAIELFIGFYDLRGPQHGGFERGAQPDYQLSLRKDVLVNGRNGDAILSDSTEYHYEDFGAADYVIETRIKLADIAFGDDVVLSPENGMRIPIDIAVHDSDAPNTRDGVVAFSQGNDDNSWQSPTNWAHTWIGDQFMTVSVGDEDAFFPTEYSLRQNYPNPFNPTTTISFSLAKSAPVQLEIFNSLGQRVRTIIDEVRAAGEHTFQIQAGDLSSGLYFYKLVTPEFTDTKKMILMK